ncbi:MAG: helix-turn-helix domain-containing protein, partial [Bacteroidales bacterium]|nr:helix-turn-helix domain-containing protein [Bacteroidales bacterium]
VDQRENKQLLFDRKSKDHIVTYPDDRIEIAEYIDDQYDNRNNNDDPSNTEILSLYEKEKELIQKALEKNKGKRKEAAKEIGISERTLYRKLKEYNLNE